MSLTKRAGIVAGAPLVVAAAVWSCVGAVELCADAELEKETKASSGQHNQDETQRSRRARIDVTCTSLKLEARTVTERQSLDAASAIEHNRRSMRDLERR